MKQLMWRRNSIGAVAAVVTAFVLVANAQLDETATVIREESADVPRFLATLDPDVVTYMGHVTTLANPFFEGRAPGTAGNEAAAEYIEFWFRRFNLEPAFPDPESNSDHWVSYQQIFGVGGGLVATREELKMIGADGEVAFTPGEDFHAVGMGWGEATAPLAFVGYGFENGPEGHEDYNSFGDIDLGGRIALLFRFEPSDDEGRSRWTETGRWSSQANLREKIVNTATRGAAGIVLVTPPDIDDPRQNELLTVERSRWGNANVPVVHMSIPAADRLVKAAGAESLAALKAKANQPDAEAFLLSDDVEIAINTAVERTQIPTSNVGGVLRGRGELADEWIVIGGHYDHVGYGRGGDAESGGTIYPGADDNASGTAGVLMLAERFSRDYEDLPAGADARSILFMGFTAEEMGLRGSRHYVEHPTLDPKQINLMINLDMIGRLREGSLEVSGVGSAEGFEEELQSWFDESGLDVYMQQTGRGPSDHSSFYGVGVPVLFFFTGIHENYHQPSDVASLINPVGAVRIIDLVEKIAWDAVTESERLVFQESEGRWNRSGLASRIEVLRQEEQAAAPGGRPQARVRLGIQPSYREEIEGVLVEAVSEGTSAADGGVQKGDLVTHWNDERLMSVADLMPHLRGAKPGDEVTLTVEREGETKKLTFKLKAAEGEN